MNTSIRRRAFAAVVALFAAAAALFAFASSNSTTLANGAGLKPAQTGAGENLYNGKKGGTLTVFDSEDFEHLDPGEAYFDLDYQIMYATQMTLFAYKPNQTTVASPLLASAQPVVTNGGKTVTIHIKPNVKFSPPVSRDVTSSDVAYAIERGANPNVGNAYFQPYFGDIVGAAKATGGPIAGILTPNATTIVFHLTAPTADLLIGALSLPLSAPVPESFAAKYDKLKPTQYGTSYEVFTGPYMLQSTSAGKFLGLGYQPGKSATLVRNPNWNPSTDWAPAYLNEIKINIGGAAQVIGLQVLKGSDSVQNDTPTNSNVELAYTKYYKQLVAVPGAGDHYVSLNNAHGLFTNVNIRRAVYAALDRTAMVKVAGGTIVGSVATHFITPGSAGYTQSGGDAGPKYAWNEYPSGNLAVAQTYMKKAGFSSGKYTGSDTVSIVGADNSNGPETSAIVKDAFTELGIPSKIVSVDQSVMYAKYCGVPKAEVDACSTVGWIRDFADPATILYVPFYGPTIVPTNNSNWGQVNNPQINAAMVTASNTVGATPRANAWAKVDDLLVNDAVAIPYIFDKQPSIESANVRGINDLWNTGSWDYAFTSLNTP